MWLGGTSEGSNRTLRSFAAMSETTRALAQQGRIGEAQEALREGEVLLREVGNPLALAKLLCTRGESKPPSATSTTPAPRSPRRKRWRRR